MSRRERIRQRQRHRGHPVRRAVGMSALFAVCAIAMGALLAVGWVVSVADSAPNLTELKARVPHPLSAIYAADGSLLGYVHSDTVYSHVSDRQIPARLKQATIAI